MESPHDTYTSPLAARNASRAMLRLWSARHRAGLWRRIWLAVASAQHQLGLPVSASQVEELKGALDVTDADLARASQHERELRHDVMAHVMAWGDRCPGARGIIHLGLTSQDVVCTADLMVLDGALDLIFFKCARLVLAWGELAARWKHAPALGFTHYQPAQPTSVGRRAAQWGYDLFLAARHLRRVHEESKFRGLRGATGTQASFLSLCAGDAAKVDRLEALAIRELTGVDCAAMVHTLTAQTYPRVFDAHVLGALGAIAAVLHKTATDLRLLANRREIDEPVEAAQVGSSAMPYKRNPMRCERVCGLSRFVMNLSGNALDTAATQWLERTLDDSSNRRLSLAESFLALDGAIDLMQDVGAGLEVYDRASLAALRAEMPFLATENIMMEAVGLGRDRQAVHDAIRRHSRLAAGAMKREGAPNDLLERLRTEPLLAGVDLERVLDPGAYIGRAPEQVDRFLSEIVAPLRTEHGAAIAGLDRPSVEV